MTKYQKVSFVPSSKRGTKFNVRSTFPIRLKKITNCDIIYFWRWDEKKTSETLSPLKEADSRQDHFSNRFLLRWPPCMLALGGLCVQIGPCNSLWRHIVEDKALQYPSRPNPVSKVIYYWVLVTKHWRNWEENRMFSSH